MTPRVTLRTLVLTLELLAAVVGFQCLAAAQTIRMDAVWLGDNPYAASPPAVQQSEPR